MKNNMEDIENKLVDYLHGELDAADKQVLEALLDADADLYAAYARFAQTVSTPDEAVMFPDKSKLLKSEPQTITRLRNWKTWAVAAAILSAVSIFIFKTLQKDSVDEYISKNASANKQTVTGQSNLVGDGNGKQTDVAATATSVPAHPAENKQQASSQKVLKRNTATKLAGVKKPGKQIVPANPNATRLTVPTNEAFAVQSIVDTTTQSIVAEMEFNLPAVDPIQQNSGNEVKKHSVLAVEKPTQQTKQEKTMIQWDAEKQPAIMKSLNGALGFLRKIRKAGEDLRRREVVVTLTKKKHEVY